MKTPVQFGSARKPIAAVLGLAVALSLAACSGTTSPGATSSGSGSTSTAAKKLRIGFSPFTLQVPALKGVADGLTAIAKSQGDTVLTADPKGDPSTQLQQLQQWVQLKQVDAIWVIPQAAKTIAPVLTQAQAKGIVVIASGTPADYGFSGLQKGMTFTNVDNKAFGGDLGTEAAKCISERLGGAGKVIFLQSAAGAQSSQDINLTFKAALAKESPNTKIVNTQIATDRLADQQKVSSALQGNPDANVLVGTDDESTLGGLAAFTSAGKSSANTCIVGAGGNAEAVADVKSGKVYSEVAFDFQADIAQNIKYLHTMAASPGTVGTQITTPIQLITK